MFTKYALTFAEAFCTTISFQKVQKILSYFGALCYTHEKTKLSDADVAKFNAQYPSLVVKHTKAFHDRFLILDEKIAYHIGASLKDAGKKCFAVNLLQDDGVVQDILQRLELETEE